MIGQFEIRSCLALLMLFCVPVFADGPTCDADHDPGR